MNKPWMDFIGLEVRVVEFLPSLRRGIAILAALALLVGIDIGGSVPQAVAAPQVSATFEDISPDGEVHTTDSYHLCPDPCVSGNNGGRVNGLSAVPGDASTYFAASEVGGLFKIHISADGSGTWSHLDNHLPTQTWDVAADPGGQRVFATSFYEGRVDLTAALQVSTDGGSTWKGSLPAAPPTCPAARASQPSGFGIAIRPGSNEVLVGTNCGLARTTDGGDHWTRFDPTPASVAGTVWDVVALPGGRTYACGDDGLLTSPDGRPESTWQLLTLPSGVIPQGFCSLAVSPDEPNVIFVIFGRPSFSTLILAYPQIVDFEGELVGGVFEGQVDYSTATVQWSTMKEPDLVDTTNMNDVKKRVPFVATNKRSQGFDLWIGDGNVYRVPCSDDQTPRCTTDTTKWEGSFTDASDQQHITYNAHGDSGTIVFDPSVSVDACPTLYSSDGGVYRNKLAFDPNSKPNKCQNPMYNFEGENAGLHAFLLWGMAGVHQTDIHDIGPEDLYIALQDNGLYSTRDADADAPTWTHGLGADVSDVVADTEKVVATNGPILLGDAGFINVMSVFYRFAGDGLTQVIVEPSPGDYMIAVRVKYPLMDGTGREIPIGVWETTDIEHIDPDHLPLKGGYWPTTANAPCHIQAGLGANGPQPYVLTSRGKGCAFGRPDIGANDLWTYRDGDWKQIDTPLKPDEKDNAEAGFGIIAVDPSNADRLYTSVIGDGDPRMMRSSNGGASWTTDQALTDFMNGHGRFKLLPEFDGVVDPFLQPWMVTFDPEDSNLIVAGGYSSGVFLSADDGATWSLLTDPFTPGTSGIPHLPRPAFAHFNHDKPGFVRIYLGTGRGVWRVELPTTDLRVTKTAAPDPAYAGESLTYTVTVANDSQSDATGVTVTDVLPAGVTYTGGSPGCTESPVGTLSCTVGALAAGTQTSLTITVAIAQNLVYANGGPKTITNTATVASEQVDTTPSNNTTSTDTLVKAKADVAIVSFGPVAPPTEVVIGHAIDLILRKIVTNHGPSSPVDITLSRTATAPAGSTVTPAAASVTAKALAEGELRTVDEPFTITCGAPGAQTFSFANTIAPSNAADVDPTPDNNTASSAVTVTCVVPVAINIRPGSFPNVLNLQSTTHVAVLTTNAGEYGLPLAFDATTIRPESVLFGPEALVFPEIGGAPAFRAKDHIKDAQELDEKTKDMDMVLQFRVSDSGLTEAATKGCVKGTFTGTGGAAFKFFGCDSVRISP
jgi:uncharacterized repeat protein (TIGR01451 family)